MSTHGTTVTPRELRPTAAPATGPLLDAHGIAKTFRTGWWPRRHSVGVLDGVELELEPGELVGLVGENGSGKSTLMKILVGSLAADRGHVRLRGRFGYCPQEPNLYERPTCDEHLELYGRAYGMDDLAVDQTRDEIYDTLGFTAYRAGRVSDLSGGTRSKLNLAIALLHDPELLLLDEPYAGFDWDTYQKFWKPVAARRTRGRSVLIISHFVIDEEAFDRVVAPRRTRGAAMTVGLLTRRYLDTYVRHPVNVSLLVTVPAAGFLVSVASFFQVSGSRAADRRLALAGTRCDRRATILDIDGSSTSDPSRNGNQTTSATSTRCAGCPCHGRARSSSRAALECTGSVRCVA